MGPPTPDNAGVRAVHAVLLHTTGKLLLWSGRAEGRSLYEAWVWTPGDPDGRPEPFDEDEFTADEEAAPFNNTNPDVPDPSVAGWDLFCSHQVQLEDGRILVVGGTGAQEAGPGLGLPAVFIFDPDASPATPYREFWVQDLRDMADGRWYPTAVVLPDGRVVVFSGRRANGSINETVELLSPPDYQPVPVDGGNKSLYIYPGLHLVRGGKIFYTGTTWGYRGPGIPTVSFEMTRLERARWNDYDKPGSSGIPLEPNFVERREGMSLLLPPARAGQILLIGGSRKKPDIQNTDAVGNLLWEYRDATDNRHVVATDAAGNVIYVDEPATTATGEVDADGNVTNDGTGPLAGVTKVDRWMLYDGITPASNPASVEILHTRGLPDDPTSTEPVWESIGDMAIGLVGDAADNRRGRANVSAVLLPDGKVCIVGGKLDHRFAPYDYVHEAEIFDPVSRLFTKMAAQGRNRGYHSVALLLPDGRVFVGGTDRTMEFFKPPYFFTEPGVDRLEILGINTVGSPPNHVHYGGTFTIEVANAYDVNRVALLRPGAITHHTDTDQRYVDPIVVPESMGEFGNDLLHVTLPYDPSVAPPGYYMVFLIDNYDRPCVEAEWIRISARKCTIGQDRSLISKDEVQALLNDEGAPAVIREAIFVHVDGFLPGELGIGESLPTGSALRDIAPGLDPSGLNINGMSITPENVYDELREDPINPRIRQRFSFAYNLDFSNLVPFEDETGATVEEKDISLHAEVRTTVSNLSGFTCDASIRLINQPNPYMTDGAVPWLSMDVRVFRIREGDDIFGVRMGGGDGAANTFILQVLTNLQLPAQDFEEELSEDQEESALMISEFEGDRRVYNFAVARVRYRGTTLPAERVRVFFRSFRTAVCNMVWDPATTYSRHVDRDGVVRPLLGTVGDKVATIPFFAYPRADKMDEQEIQEETLEGTGREEIKYFGCWLDFNQTERTDPQNLRFPETIVPGATGPFEAGTDNPLKTIQQLLRGEHQCLVAELVFGDLIELGDTPGSSDKLSQRNLAVLQSDNPGSVTSRVVEHTFDLKPVIPGSYIKSALNSQHPSLIGIPAQRGFPLLRYDELRIFWGDLPKDTEVEMFIPHADIDTMMELHRIRYGAVTFEKIDDSTIRCRVGGLTFLPIVSGTFSNIAGLLTFKLPDTIVSGQTFRVVFRQIHGLTRETVGSFEVFIPVKRAEEIVGGVSNTYAVLKAIAATIPAADRWYPVFQKYIHGMEARIRGLGGDPDQIPASGRGWLEVPPTEAYTGKVSQLLYDCFGDFDGFILDLCPDEQLFKSKEKAIEEIVRRACRERTRVTVYTLPDDKTRPFRIVLHCH